MASPTRTRVLRVRQACLAVAVAAAVAGCVNMPSNGPVVEYTASPQTTQQQSNFIGSYAKAPQPNGTPLQIVNGFLVANASDPTSPVASQYMLSAASQQWKPDSVKVFSTLGPTGQGLLPPVRHGPQSAWVNVAGLVQSTLTGSAGYFSAQGQASPEVRWTFHLTMVNGQWRISNPPPYRMIYAADFPQYYKAQDLYFFDQSDTTLVPDSVFVPLGASVQQLVTSLVGALIDKQATPWLADGVDTEFPAGTKILGNVTIEGATATVNLGGAAASADTNSRELMSAQLVWTLTGSSASPSGIQSVVLAIDGRPFTPSPPLCPGGQSQVFYQTQATYQCDNPYLSAPASFYYVDREQSWSRCGSESPARQRGLIGSVIPVVGRTGTFNNPQCGSDRGYVPAASASRPPPPQPGSLPPLSMAAVSPDGRYLAIVSPGGGALYVGTLSGRAASFPDTPRVNAPDITALSWDRNGNLWVAQSGNILKVPALGKGTVPVEFTGGSVSDLSVAPDGVRMAVIVQGTGPGRELELAAISAPRAADQRGVPSVPAGVRPGVPLGASITDPTALTWYGADDLIVLNSANTGYGLYDVPVDGQPASGPQATLPGTISITADGPANVLVAGLSDSRLAVSTSLDGSWQTLSEPGRDPAYPG